MRRWPVADRLVGHAVVEQLIALGADRAYGAWAETARTPEELGAALRARPAAGVRLIEVLVE